MKHRPKLTREEWAKRIERWKDSGQSLSAYARELGISATSLKWWKWRLHAEASGTWSEPRKKQRTPSAPKLERAKPEKTITFVELPRPTSKKAPIEIVLASRVRIRVEADFEVATLERVLAVLGAQK